MNRLANEIGWLVIGLAILISVGFVNHFVEQWLQDRLGPKYRLVELAYFALVIGLVWFVLVWALQK
jgi:hypothetical protein